MEINSFSENFKFKTFSKGFRFLNPDEMPTGDDQWILDSEKTDKGAIWRPSVNGRHGNKQEPYCIYRRKMVSKEDYLIGKRQSGIKAGDKVIVRFVRPCYTYNMPSPTILHEFGWQNSWCKYMERSLGQTYRVKTIDGSNSVYFIGEDYGFPFYALEKITEEITEEQKEKIMDVDTEKEPCLWAKNHLQIVKKIAKNHKGNWIIEYSDGSARTVNSIDLIDIPECTGFDWTPPLKQLKVGCTTLSVKNDELWINDSFLIGMEELKNIKAAIKSLISISHFTGYTFTSLSFENGEYHLSTKDLEKLLS